MNLRCKHIASEVVVPVQCCVLCQRILTDNRNYTTDGVIAFMPPEELVYEGPTTWMSGAFVTLYNIDVSDVPWCGGVN